MSNLDTYRPNQSPFLTTANTLVHSSLSLPAPTYQQPYQIEQPPPQHIDMVSTYQQPPPRSIDMPNLNTQRSAASLSMTIPEYNNFMQSSWKVEEEEDILVERASKAMFGAIMHYYKKK